MPAYYLIKDGKISNIIKLEDPTGFPFPVVPYNETVDYDWENWIYDYNSQTLVYSPVDLNLLKQRKKDQVAAIRWEKERAGTSFNSLPIPTDEVTQTKILGAALAATIDSNYTVKWKTPNGFIDLNATMILVLAQTIRTHIQLCFDKEAELTNMIDQATDKTSLDSIDISTNWP